MVSRLALWLMLMMPAFAAAQDHQPLPPGPQSGQSVQLVKTGLFVVSGGGGNTAVRLSGNGIILVDGKLQGQYRGLMAKVTSIADELPVRMLIITSSDEVHSGTNSEFLMHGIPVISLPSATFDKERTIRLGGVTVEIIYFGPARTDADAVVYFPDLKVIAVGDLYSSSTPSVRKGGCLSGWADALQEILRLDFDKVVPGSGPVTDRAGLLAFKTQIDAMAVRTVCQSRSS